MFKKLFFILLTVFLLLPQITLGEESTKVHPCETAWNDKMKEYSDEYLLGLNNLLFQKKTTTALIDSEAISYNLRSHNCMINQICEAVSKSSTEDPSQVKVTGQLLRCQPKSLSEFGEILEKCNNTNTTTQLDTFSLLGNCHEDAQDHIEYIEMITETELSKSSSAKKTSNLVGYLIQLNTKLDALTMQIGDMIGTLFDVTRKMACGQKTCN